jgi:hypothetical protein
MRMTCEDRKKTGAGRSVPETRGGAPSTGREWVKTRRRTKKNEKEGEGRQ